MIDYVLTVAVGVSAGIGALISAIPTLQPYTVELCLAVLAIVTIVNLRGTAEAGVAFALPTYLFIGSLFTVLAIGICKTVASGRPSDAGGNAACAPAAAGAVSIWLLVRSFASGCTAMTGVEAVSNGVTAFREPARARCRAHAHGDHRHPCNLARLHRVSLPRVSHRRNGSDVRSNYQSVLAQC